eukprot:gene5622-5861_t
MSVVGRQPFGREQVIQRIEQLVQQLVAAAAAGTLPELTCISTAASNVHLADVVGTAVHRSRDGSTTARGTAAQGVAAAAADSPSQQQLPGAMDNLQDERHDQPHRAPADSSQQQPQQVLRLGSQVQKKTLLAGNGAQAHSIVRVLQLLDVAHALLTSGRTATQRDIYYSLTGPPFFNSQRDLTAAINTALTLLKVPRAALGIAAASKGAVAGRLLLRAHPAEAYQDCSLTGPAGRAIPGDVAAIGAMSIRLSGARFILVVEKDAIFQRLVEDRLFDELPCVIITGRGMPDIASRAFLAALVRASSSQVSAGDGGGRRSALIPVLGLVDWNPAGVAILLSYKFGCAAMGLEAAQYAVPSLTWLGVTSDMLTDVPGSACQALTARDKTQLTNLKARLAQGCPGWVSELEEMEAVGLKADIEALYSVVGHAGLRALLVQRVLQRQYLM